MNELILGDNLDIMKKMEKESIDLIYLDPPFFSNRNYEVIWGDKGEIRSFQDRWAGGVENYITWLKARVEQMWRLLKPTGSIYLHCDWHADAYIRTEILDRIFGYDKFIASIVWHYSWGSRTPKRWNRKHDVIFHYAKSNKMIFNAEEVLDERVLSEASQKRMEYKGAMIMKSPYIKKGTNLILPSDVWYIATINAMSKERIGYPTQKPKKLIERIIKASSNEGDIVLDPFVGGGTTIIVADELQRKWIGIDQSPIAIRVSDFRLAKECTAWSQPYVVRLHKYDYDELRNKEAFDFESFIIGQFGGMSNTKQRGDFGIDGVKDNIPIQVKRSDNIGRNVIDNFKSALERYDKTRYEQCIRDHKTAGYIIAFSFARGAVEEVARLKLKDNIIIELIKVENIIPISKKPTLQITMESKLLNTEWEISFTAMGGSSSGIEFYSWDFHYNAERGFNADIMIDKTGIQKQVYTAGEYTIAVKVVDTDGLENIEVVKLKVNGEISLVP